MAKITQNTKTMFKAKNRLKTIEICNECGRNVSWRSDLFINRVMDFDDYKTRKEMNKPFPKGGYICRECEETLNKNYDISK